MFQKYILSPGKVCKEKALGRGEESARGWSRSRTFLQAKPFARLFLCQPAGNLAHQHMLPSETFIDAENYIAASGALDPEPSGQKHAAILPYCHDFLVK